MWGVAGSQIGADERARAGEVALQIGARPGDVETVAALLALGVEPRAMKRALERGRLEDAIFDDVLDPARAERKVSAAEIERRGGMPAGETRLLLQSAGLPPPDPDEPAFTEEEAWAFVEVGKMREVWTPDLGLQSARVAGRALTRIAHTQVQSFRLHVQPRLMAQAGDDPVAALENVHWAFERLLPLAEPFLGALYRRLFERELAEVVVSEAEARAGEGALPGAVETAIMFCDLKDFTAYADTEGDEAAVDAIEHLALVVTEECGTDGRIVKGLGDGYMVAFPDTLAAVNTAWRIIVRRRDEGGPGVHSSIHRGVAVVHEGDYFGTVVNLAARILAAAKRDELVATTAVAEATASDFTWEHAGESYVRGVRERVALHLLVGPRGRG
jgi:adenylate cyclase